MKPKANMIAQKLLNLYRQEHVIIGGWATVNPVFVNEADESIIDELRDMPTGLQLIQHIENLRSGKTPMNSIERELMPYGGNMAETIAPISMTASEFDSLEFAINAFTPDQNGLDAIQRLPVVQKYENQWQGAIRASLAGHPDLLKKWTEITQTYRAYNLWGSATEMMAAPLSERARATLQADIPEYETFLPMFGKAGTELLAKLRKFISTREEVESDADADTLNHI